MVCLATASFTIKNVIITLYPFSSGTAITSTVFKFIRGSKLLITSCGERVNSNLLEAFLLLING